MDQAKNFLRAHFFTLLLIILIPLFFLSCTKDTNSSSGSADRNPPTKTVANQEQIEKDLLAEQNKLPTIVDNASAPSPESEAEVFRFSNEAQRFTLTKLGHLVNSEFQCKATLKLAFRDKEESGTIKLSFGKNDLGQNEFKATWWPFAAGQKPFYIANKKEVCGEKRR